MKQLLFTSACVLALIASTSAQAASNVGDDGTLPTIVQKNTYNAETDDGLVYYGGTGLNGNKSGNTNPTVVGATGGSTPDAGCPSSPSATINASDIYRKFYTDSSGVARMFQGSSYVIELNVAPGDTTVGDYLAEATFSDFRANRGSRIATVSRTMCDYSTSAMWLGDKSDRHGWNAGGGTIAINDPRPASASITAGHWYINIKNVDCVPKQTCEAVVQWQGPSPK